MNSSLGRVTVSLLCCLHRKRLLCQMNCAWIGLSQPPEPQRPVPVAWSCFIICTVSHCFDRIWISFSTWWGALADDGRSAAAEPFPEPSHARPEDAYGDRRWRSEHNVIDDTESRRRRRKHDHSGKDRRDRKRRSHTRTRRDRRW